MMGIRKKVTGEGVRKCVCVCVTLKRHMQFVPTKESFWEETVLSKVQEVSVYTGRRLYVERVIG